MPVTSPFRKERERMGRPRIQKNAEIRRKFRLPRAFPCLLYTSLSQSPLFVVNVPMIVNPFVHEHMAAIRPVEKLVRGCFV
jgi:hypothetical protein